jgi:ABC-type sugar transport system ATPase subunit
LASLDPIARLELRSVIRNVQRELRLTTLYVTHDQSEASAVADRIAIMREGVLEQSGPPLELYQDPATLFVAQFFGNGLNIIPGTNGGELVAFRPSAGRLVVSDSGAWVVQEQRDLGWNSFVRLKQGDQEAICEIREQTAFKPGQKVDLQTGATLRFDAKSGRRVRI